MNTATNILLNQIRLQSVGYDCLQVDEDQFTILSKSIVLEEDEIVKAIGKKDTSKLVKIQKVDKRGRKMTYWFDPNKDKDM